MSTIAGLSSAEITSFVRDKPYKMHLDDYFQAFTAQHVLCETDIEVQDVSQMALLHAVRGAFGHQLKQAASLSAQQGRACDFRPASLYDICFLPRFEANGRALPSPYRFTISAINGRYVLGLILFGVCSDWAPAAAELMSLTCSAPLNIQKQQLKIIILSRSVYEVKLDDIMLKLPARLLSLTPMRARSDGKAMITIPSIKASLLQRLYALSAFHGVCLQESANELKGLCEQIDLRLVNAEPTTEARHSGGQKRSMDIEGYLVQIKAEAASQKAAHILAHGVFAGLGSSISLGYGQFANINDK